MGSCILSYPLCSGQDNDQLLLDQIEEVEDTEMIVEAEETIRARGRNEKQEAKALKERFRRLCGFLFTGDVSLPGEFMHLQTPYSFLKCFFNQEIIDLK